MTVHDNQTMKVYRIGNIITVDVKVPEIFIILQRRATFGDLTRDRVDFSPAQ